MSSYYSESLRSFLRPVLPFLDDPTVTEIMINGPTSVWIERHGRIEAVPDVAFTEDSLLAAARNVAQFVGRVLSDERPRLDARMPDGSRLHVVLPPIARSGVTLAIRKFAKDALSMEELVRMGAASPAMSRFLEAAVRLKLNTIVGGGTGAGKTTLLNVLSRFIPSGERILVIEDSAELQLQQPHVVSFEARPPDRFGKGEVTIGDLLDSALRLRPDRIVVGEVRGGEAFFLLQAMNSGHGGSLSTSHANTPRDLLRRLEALCLMSGIDLPVVAIRAQLASSLHLLITCERQADGARRITHISEVLPLDDRGDYRTQDLFVFTPTGKDAEGRIRGYHAPTGILPTFLQRLPALGYGDVDEAFFDPATYDVPPPPGFHADDVVRTRWAPSLRHRERSERGGYEDEPVPDLAEVDRRLAGSASPAPAPFPVEPEPAEITTNEAPRVSSGAIDEPTIQIAPELLAEAEAVLRDDERTDPHVRVRSS